MGCCTKCSRKGEIVHKSGSVALCESCFKKTWKKQSEGRKEKEGEHPFGAGFDSKAASEPKKGKRKTRKKRRVETSVKKETRTGDVELFLEEGTVKLYKGDCRDVLARLEENSVDTVITDPPYALTDKRSPKRASPDARHRARVKSGGFMGMKWDVADVAFDPATWQAVLRIAKPGAFLLAFGGCYDGQTEVLTKRGWVLFPEVQKSDLFASLNPETRLVEWQCPVELIRKKHDGPMYAFHTNKIDLLVTPNHKMFVATLGRRNTPFHLVKAEAVPKAVRMTKTSNGRCDINGSEFFVLKGMDQAHGHGTFDWLREKRIPWKNWLPFFGLWLAEGSAYLSEARAGHGYVVSLAHFNINNLKQIAWLLKPYFDAKVYPKLGKLKIHSKQLFQYLRSLGHAPDKYIPAATKRLSPSRLRLLLGWYARGDGDKEGRIYTSSSRLRDDVQEIAMYAGWAADWSVRPPKDGKIGSRTIHARHPQYVIRLLKKQTRPEVYQRRKEKLTRSIVPRAAWGRKPVFCAELERNHTLYVRRNGKAVWCGNTRTWHRLACAIEDAGWEVRDCVMWMYSQGFPKSINIALQLEQKLCERKKIKGTTQWFYKGTDEPIRREAPFRSLDANVWAGRGSNLKPAHEPILCAMKPLDGTFAENALKHGVAGLNIDGGRIGYQSEADKSSATPQGKCTSKEIAAIGAEPDAGRDLERVDFKRPKQKGRWPANLALSHTEDCRLVGYVDDKGYIINRFKDGAKPFGDGAGHEYETEKVPGGRREVYACIPDCPVRMLDDQTGVRGGSGGASRFFKAVVPEKYCALCFGTIVVGGSNKCDSAKTAANHSIQQKKDGVSAGIPAQQPHQQGSGAKLAGSSIPVLGVGRNSSSSQATSENTAQNNAPATVYERAVQAARCVGNLCNVCITAIAHALVEVRQNQEPASLHSLVSISVSQRTFLSQRLVQFVESLESIDTTPIMEDLTKLFGSVLAVTEEHISSAKNVQTIVSAPTRFLYTSKASKKERNTGLPKGVVNKHPTLKPLGIMEYLCRLTATPTGGVVLDPFMGSGTTGVACIKTGRRFVGIDNDPESCRIAGYRVKHALKERK